VTKRSHIDDKIAALAEARPVSPRKAKRAGHGGCARKDRYPSAEAARAVALMNGMGQQLTTYRCEECDEWHLTHRRK
jgi:hypothetical protein